jgi:hypothetical protein
LMSKDVLPDCVGPANMHVNGALKITESNTSIV